MYTTWNQILNTILPLKGLIQIVFFWTLLFGFMFFTIYLSKEYRNCRNSIKWLKNTQRKYEQNGFVAKYEELKEELSSNPFWGNLWSEFDQTLVKKKSYDGIDAIYSTIDAGYIFNETSIIAPKINLQLYNALPGIFTAFGIMGTFLGLTVGLSQINLGSDDVQVLKEGIKGLLSGVAVAFSTSLWGIIFSVIFSGIEKVSLNKLRNHIVDLQVSINNAFVRKVPESWLAEVLDESKEQTSELKTFNEDIAINIAAALDERLDSRLTPTFDRLIKAIEELTSTGSSTIAETITSEAGQEIQKLSVVLKDVKDALKETVSNSYELQRRMEQSLDTHINGVGKVVNNLVQSTAERQREINEEMQQKVQQLMSKIEENLERQNEKMEIVTSRTGEELTKQVDEISNKIAGILNGFEEQTGKRLTEMRSQAAEMTEKFRDVLEQVSQNYNEQRTSISLLMEQFKATLNEMKAVISEASQLANTFGQIAIPLKEGGLELQKVIGDLQSYQNNFADTVKQSHEQMQKYTRYTEQSLETIRSALDQTQSAWRAYEDKFGVIKGDLEAIFDEIGNGLAEYKDITVKGITSYLDLLDKHLAKATGLLSAAVEQFEGTVEALDDTLNKYSTN